MPVSPLQIRRPAGGTYAIACSPVIDKYSGPHQLHESKQNGSTTLTTGLPVVVYGDTAEEVCDLLFSSYTLGELGELTDYVVRDIALSTGYDTEAEALEFATDAQEEVAGLLMRPLKHPDRDEWALPVSSHILATKGRGGDKRQKLEQKMTEKAAAGKHIALNQARSAGWNN